MLKLKFLKHYWQRVTARVLVITLLVVLVAGLLINLYFSPILGRTVKSTVLSSSDSLYRIEFTDAALHIFQGKIVMYNIDVKPDMAVYARLQQRGLQPNNLYRLHIKKLVLSHIHPFKLYFKRKLDIGEIVLSAPELNINYRLNRTKDTTAVDNRNLYQRISKTLKSISVGHIGLNDVVFKYQGRSGNKVEISELKELNLSADGLLIDSASMTDKSRFLYCREVITEINNFSGVTPNGLYRYQVKYLKLSTLTSKVTGEGVDLEPLKAEQFFSKSTHDRFTIHVDSLQLNNFDYLNFHKYRKLSATSLVLSKGRLGVFSNPYINKQQAAANADRFATFPNAGIYKLKTDLKIDSVLIRRFDISYTELNAKSQKLGYVTFNRSNATILNLTTNPAALQKNKFCNVAIRSYFMNKGQLDVRFNFNLTAPNLAYSYKGHLEPVSLNIVNPAAMTLAMVKINSGTLKSFDFDIEANRNVSHGRVAILYNDLKVTLLKPDTAKNKMKRMTIASFFANAMVIKHNNPDKPGEPARAFYVNNPRPKGDAFFKAVWKTLLTGIRQCAGYGEQKENEIKTQMAERKINKAQRQEKKAARKARREERKKLKAEKGE